MICQTSSDLVFEIALGTHCRPDSQPSYCGKQSFGVGRLLTQAIHQCPDEEACNEDAIENDGGHAERQRRGTREANGDELRSLHSHEPNGQTEAANNADLEYDGGRRELRAPLQGPNQELLQGNTGDLVER